MVPRAPRALIVAALATFYVAGAGGAGFRDVLDTPAVASPIAAKGLFNGLARAGGRIIAVGQRGHAMFSHDGGRTWTQARVPVSSDLVAVSFPSALRGWAVGHDGVILHSTDGGTSWALQRDGRAGGRESLESPLLDVWFENDSTGYAVGAFNTALRTDDGGVTWRSFADRVDNPKRLHLYSVRPAGGALHIAGEQGLLLQLDPRENRFRAVTLPYNGTLFGVTGGDRAVVVFGLRGNAFRSTDSGRSWKKIETNLQVGLTAGDATGDRVLLASQAGHVLASDDGGESFRALKLDRPMPAAAVLSFDRLLVLAGPRGLSAQPAP